MTVTNTAVASASRDTALVAAATGPLATALAALAAIADHVEAATTARDRTAELQGNTVFTTDLTATSKATVDQSRNGRQHSRSHCLTHRQQC